jgi:hypothetical protein
MITYGIGGALQYGSRYGWMFYQPGRGGRNFVRLQGASWSCVSLSLFLPWLLRGNGGSGLVVSGALGFIAQVLTVTSLFAYQPPRQPFKWRFFLQHRPDGRVWFFIFVSVQVSMAVYALVVLWVSESLQSFVMAQVALLTFFCLIATSVSLTHGVGGPLLHVGYEAYQPGRGGFRFVAMQSVGWVTFGLSLAIAISRLLRVVFASRRMPFLVNIMADDVLPVGGAISLGLLGLFSQFVITLSLLVFEEDELAKARRHWNEARARERAAFLSCRTGLPADVKAIVYDFI